MAAILKAGDQAVVVAGGGGNRVRVQPRVGATIKGVIPEHAVVMILAQPAGWAGAYPHDDGKHVWVYARGRTEGKRADGRFKVIEGWTAISENGMAFLDRRDPAVGCQDTMGTSLETHLEVNQQAYVLPPKGLNVRKEADPLADRIGGLGQGTIVTIVQGPVCDTKMVWWRVKPLNAAGPAGWVSEGNILEWFLAPLTLM